MEPTIHDFADTARFELDAKIEHQHLRPFISQLMQIQSPVTWTSQLAMLTVLATTGYYFGAGVVGAIQGGADAAVRLVLLLAGGAGFTLLALVPLHEWIHGLTYKAFGATDVRYSYSIKGFYFYAMAHRFIANARAFFWIAVMPTLVINSMILLLIVLLPELRLGLLVALAIHLSGAIGDFALINYLWLHRGGGVYTYDDAEVKESYFYLALLDRFLSDQSNTATPHRTGVSGETRSV